MKTSQWVLVGVVFAAASFSACAPTGSSDAGTADSGTAADGGQPNDGGPSCGQTDCAGLTWCDATSGVCRAGCERDAQCGTNETCDRVAHACGCSAGFHSCGNSCVPNNAVTSCGQSCTACTSKALATTSCDGTQCNYDCQTNARSCGGQCVACPIQGVSATTCSGGACIASTCSTGYSLCGTTCSACPTTGVVGTTCEGTTCVATGCQSGYARCGTACVACAPGDLFCCKETIDAQGNTGSQTSLALADAGVTYVAYRDETQEDLLVASREADAGTWAIERIATAGDVGQGTSIAAGADGTVHVSYYDRGASRMKYARKQVGGSWTFETLDNTAVFVPGRTSIKVDSAGNPKVALYANNTLRFAERSSAGWSSVQVDATAGTLASLALDASDNPHISYSISGNQSGAHLQLLKYATRSGTGWSTETVFQNTVISAAIESAIAIDGAGQPHIVFHDSNFLSLKYAKKNGTSWLIQMVAGNGAGSGNSLAFDPSGGLHATYHHSLAGKLMYATLIAGNWSSITVEAFNVPEAFSSLSFDITGKPHVAYWDANPMGHLRYAH